MLSHTFVTASGFQGLDFGFVVFPFAFSIFEDSLFSCLFIGGIGAGRSIQSSGGLRGDCLLALVYWEANCALGAGGHGCLTLLLNYNWLSPNASFARARTRPLRSFDGV